jgi:hypothetical protein
VLTKLEITNESILTPGVAFNPNGSASTDLIHVRSISGLGAADATIDSTPYGTIDGATITGATVNLRNIVLTLGFRPDVPSGKSVSILRDEVYRYFMPKSYVTLTFERLGQPTVRISGMVEKLEPNHFSNDPEVQVSILCADPNFRATTPTVVTGTCLQASDNNAGNYTLIDYAGNVPTGVALTIEGNTASLADSWHLVTAAPLIQDFYIYAYVLTNTNDVLYSSIDGEKYFKDSGNDSLLNRVVDGSDWIKLHPGSNLFAFAAENLTIASNDRPTWTMTYYARFGGI